MKPATFVDYYLVLDVSPTASSETIEHKFRHLARRYHPDNQATGDRSRFDAIIEAHDTLRDVLKRAKYHEDHQSRLPPFSPVEDEVGEAEQPEGSDGGEEPLFSDGLGIDRDLSIQNNLMIMLYLKRRRNPGDPGLGDAELARLSGCPHEHLEFHLWYLKAKGWVAPQEDGLLAITIDGVDRAAAIYQENAKKLITDQS